MLAAVGLRRGVALWSRGASDDVAAQVVRSLDAADEMMVAKTSNSATYATTTSLSTGFLRRTASACADMRSGPFSTVA